MEQKIKQYIDSFFINAPHTMQVAELREEILQNTLDRYRDAMDEGKSPEQAYQVAVSGIGDVKSLLNSMIEPQTAQKPAVQSESQRNRRADSHKQKVIIAIVAIVAAVMIVGMLTTTLIARYVFGIQGVLSVVFDAIDDWNPFHSEYIYENKNQYQIGSVSLEQTIREIDINWLVGHITVEAYDGTVVELSESETEDADNKLRYYVDRDKLNIEFRKSGFYKPSDSIAEKDLTIKIPVEMAKNMRELDIDAVSASVSLSGLVFSDEVSIETASGKIDLQNVSATEVSCNGTSGDLTARELTANTVSFESVSGNCKIFGNIRRFQSETVSGTIDLVTETNLEKAECDTVSGNITFGLPKSNGFTANFDSMSGKFFCQLGAVNSSDNDYIYGNGSGDFSFNTVSANVTVGDIHAEDTAF